MTQHSEERLPESGSSADEGAPNSARILPFERPQSDLQRAIQQRAQERLDRERERTREERRPQPLKWVIVFAIAIIPVILIFGAVDGFLRVMHKVNAMNSAAPAQTQEAPAEVEPPAVSQPGVVILQPYGAPPQSERPAPADTKSQDAAENSETPPGPPR